MSKYDKLWQWIQSDGCDQIRLTFDEVGEIAGVPLDHAFLRFKKELEHYGYQVKKISLKEKWVEFVRTSEA